jgi:hypothetical protein
VVGVIGAGAFVAFGRSVAEELATGGYRYEGMLPVRRLARATAAAAGQAGESKGEEEGGGVAGDRRRARSRAATLPGRGGREWWELNEAGTILRGERSGTALRLGDPIVVRVARVDPGRGRVDLDPALAEEERNGTTSRPAAGRASAPPGRKAGRRADRRRSR